MHRGHLDRTWRLGVQRHLAVAGVERVDAGHRRVIGVDEPDEGPAAQALDRTGERAGTRQRDRLHQGAVGGAVQGQFAHPVSGARHEEQGLVEFVAVQQGESVEDRIVILGDEIPPVLGCPGARFGHRQAGARGVQVGAHVDAPVAAERQPGLRVDIALHEDERRLLGCAGGQIGDPEVVARLGALRCRHLQPVTVPADFDAVVVRHRHAGAEDEDVRLGGRTDAVQEDATVEVALAFGQQRRIDASHVVVRLAAGQPGDGGVAAAVDRAFEDVPGRDVHDVQQ